VKRNGLILAGGIIAILRGVFGTLTGLGGFSLVAEVEQIAPGYGLIYTYEVFVSVAVLAIGVFAVVKANDPQSAGIIRVLGYAVIAAGIIDFIWATVLFGVSAAVIASGLGAIAALVLIGSLLVVGSGRLASQNG
jgi:hypothetical protein